MNFNLPFTQRHMIELVIYAVLVYNVVSSLFYLLCQVALPYMTWLPLPVAGTPVRSASLDLKISLVFALVFLPFVSRIARAVAGDNASEVVSGRHVLSLVFPCVGLMLFMMSLSGTMRNVVELLRLLTISSVLATAIFPLAVQRLVLSVVGVFVGLAFAFSPSLFAALSPSKQDEKTAA